MVKTDMLSQTTVLMGVSQMDGSTFRVFVNSNKIPLTPRVVKEMADLIFMRSGLGYVVDEASVKPVYADYPSTDQFYEFSAYQPDDIAKPDGA